MSVDMSAGMSPNPSAEHATSTSLSLSIRIFACFAVAYLLSYGLRTINAVIAPLLVAEIGLSAANLGLLSSAYFLGFIITQLPLGLALDKFGARRVNAALLLVAATGVAAFGMSHSLLTLWWSRLLIGMGFSAALMSAFKGFREWFAPSLQPRLASWMVVAGVAGASLSTAPVQWLTQLYGWRPLFLGMAVCVLVAALLLYVLLPASAEESQSAASRAANAPAASSSSLTQLDANVDQVAQPVPAAAKSSTRTTSTLNIATNNAALTNGYRTIFRSRFFMATAPLGMTFQGGFLVMQSLWIGPWLVQVMDMSAAASAQVLLVMNLFFLAASGLMGWLSPRLTQQGHSIWQLVIVFYLGVMLVEGMLALVVANWWWLWVLLAMLMSAGAWFQSCIAGQFAAQMTGRANTAYNFMLFLGALLLQWGFGLGVDAFRAAGLAVSGAFRATLLVYLSLQLIAWLRYVLWYFYHHKSPVFKH